MLRTSVLLFMAALGLMLGLAVHFADDRPVLYTYTGADDCQGCHASTAAGEIFQAWKQSPHASARDILNSEQAQQYLTANNLEQTACLKCHTTLGRTGLNEREQKINAEGVSCERCHGPGSGYSQSAIMKDRESFMQHGGSPGSLENCYTCHASELGNTPIHCPFQTEEFNAEQSWPEIAHPIRASRSWSDSNHSPLVDSTLQEEKTTQ